MAHGVSLIRRPRLLFLSQSLPYPPDGGVHIRTYNILRLLARAFDITGLCFYRAATRPTQEHVQASMDGLRELAEVEVFRIPQETSRIRFALDHLRSMALRRVYTVFTYQSSRFRRRLRDHLRSGRFDLVHVDSLDLSSYLPMLSGIPVVCVHHNVESVLLRRRAEAERLPLPRRYLRQQAGLMEKEEGFWCPRVDLNVAVSRADREALQRLAPAARFTVLPNGVDTTAFRPLAPGDDGIVFVGGCSWFPNRDALAYFCEQILPLIRSRNPTIPARWVGRASAELRSHHAERYGIDLTGYVEDIRPHVAAAACYVVPLRVGGGTRLKILDAWAMGKAVVSTSIGCEGLAAVDGENILIRDDPGAFAQAVQDVLEDPELRRRIGANARRTAERTYSWDVIGESMIREYGSLLEYGSAVAGSR